MFRKPDWLIRPAEIGDMKALSQLVHFDAYVHRHLDYRAPFEWIGSHPFLVLEQKGKIEAALICPPDPPQAAWIRLFASLRRIHSPKAWEMLWKPAKSALRETPGLIWVAAIPLQNWFKTILEKSLFEVSHHIVMMKWNRQPINSRTIKPEITVRTMTREDLPAVLSIDHSAFVPVWQNSGETLEIAFHQAGIASVALFEGRIAGYQISTPTHMGGHLARLAVLSELQGRGIGSVLLADVLDQFTQRGASVMTVNTQMDNQASLSLYKKAGFEFSGEEYPVYLYDLENSPSI